MKNIILAIFFGFVLAQVAGYSASGIVGIMQDRCDPLWTEGHKEEYQLCMENEKALSLAADIVGFNFIYSGRKLILGY